jgi:hypothetical protein
MKIEDFENTEYWEKLDFLVIPSLVNSIYSFITYKDAVQHLFDNGFRLSEDVFKSDECKLVDVITKNEKGQIISNSYELFLPIEILHKLIIL